MVAAIEAAAKEYTAGFAAGLATVIVGHPFDTVKVKLQAHNTISQVKEYNNAFRCTQRILVTEGVKGLYRGASSVFVGMSFEGSISFGTYSQMKQLLQGKTQSNIPQLHVIFPSGACAGALISFILSPLELIKCRMQVQEKGVETFVRYKGPIDCARKTIETEGLKGMFRGGLSTLLRESIGNAVFFSTYESCRYYMHKKLNSASPANRSKSAILTDTGIGIVTGGLAGTAFWLSVLPFDVAKTVIQTTTDPRSNANPFSTLSSIYKTVGLRGWYAGLGPTLLRAFPANAAAIVAWESSAKILGIQRV